MDLPRTRYAPFVRTDFSNDGAWREIVAAVTRESDDGFLPNIDIIDDSAFQDVGADELARSATARNHAVLFVADAATIAGSEHPILCLDPDTGQSFRILPAELWSAENNLSLANMDFEEFAGAVGPDGVFRGFD